MKKTFLLAFFFISASSFSQSKKEQIELLNNRVDSLNQVVNAQSKTISDINAQISGLNAKVTNLESTITSLNAELSKLNTELQGNKNENTTKSKEISQLQALLKTKTDSLTLVLSELEKLKPAPKTTVTTTNQVPPTGPYKSVKIGTQTWMTENLNVSTFRNGDPIPEAKTNEEWVKAGENEQPAWCYYDNDPANGAKYGKLYNWYAVNDSRGLAPTGWRIPSVYEWKELTDFLYDIRGFAAIKMKSTNGWEFDWNGTNESGFSALPGGFRYDFGSFYFVGQGGHWWSSTKDSDARAMYYYLGYGVSGISEKQYGYSVRCIKD
jgi:uncharacterized protein (TIGR02145 family)